jgi:NADP-dependent 3-hydroxy acid dehydrogenase YdfG
LGGVGILVNKAGVIDKTLLSDGSTDDWRNVLEVKVLNLFAQEKGWGS